MNAHPASPTASELEAYWMPFTANRQFKGKPRMLARAAGMYYETPEGRKILDGAAGLWCVNAGHGRKEITDAVARQLEVMDYAPPFQIGHPAAFELANALVRIAPSGLDHVFFTNSGSESVDTALKIALAYHRVKGDAARVRLLGRERGYHGVGFGGISVGGMVANRKVWPASMIPGVDHLPHTHDLKRNAFSRGLPAHGAELADDLERLVALHDASTIAAVIVEPIAGSTGVVLPPQGYLKRLRQICDKHGLLLIFDEVITGFGRTGSPFAAQEFDVDARHHDLRQGAHQWRHSHGRRAGHEEDLRSLHAGPPERHRTVPWLHVFGASHGLRRRTRHAGDLRARAICSRARSRWRRHSNRPCTACAACRMSSTCAITDSWPASSWIPSPARPARAPSASISSASSAAC